MLWLQYHVLISFYIPYFCKKNCNALATLLAVGIRVVFYELIYK